MKRSLKKLIAVLSSLGTVAILTTAQKAGAVSLTDWDYAIDSFEDSTAGNYVGGTEYEIYGTAISQTTDGSELIFAINANVPLTGVPNPNADDGNVSWNDIFLNFTNKSFTQAENDGDLIGIRFDPTNEANLTETGVFTGVRTKTVAQNNGSALTSLSQYNSWVRKNGKNPGIGDLSADTAYYDQSRHVSNVMTSGTKIGDVNILEGEMLSNSGLNFGQFGATGAHTIAISVDADPDFFPIGQAFLASFGIECNNDITAQYGELIDPPIDPPKDVPEPSSVMASVAFGLFVIGLRHKRKQKKA